MFVQAGPDFVIKRPHPIWQYFHFCDQLLEGQLWNMFACSFWSKISVIIEYIRILFVQILYQKKYC
jgi:hypothetical protein